jgi:hypothetical protein
MVQTGSHDIHPSNAYQLRGQGSEPPTGRYAIRALEQVPPFNAPDIVLFRTFLIY